MPPKVLPKVFIVTWCRSPALLYGSTLTFDTLRTGFPDAEVTVVENASVAAARAPIRAAAEAAGCTFLQLEDEQAHWSLIESLTLGEAGPVVFLDPDLVFWKRVQEWDFGESLMAGRRLPEFADSFTDTLTLARLHTSHLWFPDPPRLKAFIEANRKRRFEQGSLFEPKMLPPGWWRWDTAAALYHALGDDAAAFDDGKLDAYDHLFCGSHLPLVAPKLDPENAALMSDSHARAKTDVASLKGLWRAQAAYFASRPWSGRVESVTAPGVVPKS